MAMFQNDPEIKIPCSRLPTRGATERPPCALLGAEGQSKKVNALATAAPPSERLTIAMSCRRSEDA
jgi:hypothetical protein